MQKLEFYNIWSHLLQKGVNQVLIENDIRSIDQSIIPFEQIFSLLATEVYFYFFNSLAPGRFKGHFMWVILQLISVIDGWGIHCKIPLRLMSLNLIVDNSTLVQVIALCRQATSHYPNLCQYAVTKFNS